MPNTEVILLEKIENLGEMGDRASVKPGFARNYLLPQNKALRATKENIAYFETQKKHLEQENEKRRKEAEKLADKIKDHSIILIRQASEAGQLYGSVAARDISEAVSEQTGQKIGRAMVNLNQNFKSIGLFDVELILHPEVRFEIKVNIARSEDEAKIQSETGKALVADSNDEKPLEEIVADAAVEAELEDVLEDSALIAEKEKQAEEAKKAEAEAEARTAALAAAEAEENDAAPVDSEAAKEEAQEQVAEIKEAESDKSA